MTHRLAGPVVGGRAAGVQRLSVDFVGHAVVDGKLAPHVVHDVDRHRFTRKAVERDVKSHAQLAQAAAVNHEMVDAPRAHPKPQFREEQGDGAQYCDHRREPSASGAHTHFVLRFRKHV